MSQLNRKDVNTDMPQRVNAEVETEDFTQSVPQARLRPELVQIPRGTELRGRYHYRVDSQLGKGGFGYVYTGTCLDSICDSLEGPSQRVVLKFFDPPLGLDPVMMLKRELSALLALKHDRIIRVYDWSLEQPYAFVALEFFPRGSLHDAAFPDGLDDEEAAWKLLEDLLGALNAAHRASILHLDIKPGNVLLDSKGGYVLTDFGISQGSLVSRQVIDFGVGSLGYQAPEQRNRRDDQIGVLTDLWGVGATVWSVFSGLRLDLHDELFLGGENYDGSGLLPVSQFRACTPALEQVLATLLAVNPAMRPGGAAEALKMVHALRYGDSPADGAVSGLECSTVLSEAEIRPLLKALVDPLWANICCTPVFGGRFLKFRKNQLLCREGDNSHQTFVLLRGRVAVEQRGKILTTETREGTFLGEVATLTGGERMASVRADGGDVFVLAFNAAELERFVTENPAVGIRLIRNLADRVSETNRMLRAVLEK